MLPRDSIRVAESGVARAEQVRALRGGQYDAILIGEALLRAADPAATLRDLITAGG